MSTSDFRDVQAPVARPSNLRRALQWVTQFMSVISSMSVELSQAITMCKAFETNDLAYFEDLAMLDEVAGLRRELESHVDKLVLEQKDLELMIQKCTVRMRMVCPAEVF